MLTVGDIFPDFHLDGVNENNEIIKYNGFEENWSVFYFYPKDFTFICPTEIAEMDRLVDEGVFVMGISGDNEFCKLNWKENNSLINGIRPIVVCLCLMI
jgi:peroxiredoxin (alkyl hydroperoxide reductase subunit C)